MSDIELDPRWIEYKMEQYKEKESQIMNDKSAVEAQNKNELKCPFCQQEYIITKDDFCFGQQRCVCRNPNCEFDGWHFPIKLVSELIRTRKALDVAIDAIKNATEYLGNQEPLVDVMAMNLHTDLSKALEQITALEKRN